MSLYTEITRLSRDPIIGLTEQFKNDHRKIKYNLGVGVYLDENGNVPVLESVKIPEVKERITELIAMKLSVHIGFDL